jgi:hypothetical protein
MRTMNASRGQRGSAMVISLLVLLVLTMVGTLFLATSNTETQISGHDMRATQALFNAEAGYAEALARMSDLSDTTNYIGQPMNAWVASPGWGRYIVTANGASGDDPDVAATESDGLDNDGDGAVDEMMERYPELKSKQLRADAIGYDWVKVRYRVNAGGQALLYGDHDGNPVTPPQMNLVSGFPVIQVTAHGNQGGAQRTVEVDAVKTPFTAVQAAIYSEDDQFKFNGTSWLVSGLDWHPDSPGDTLVGSTRVPGIITTEDPDEIVDALNHQQTNNIEGAGGSPSVTDTNIDLDLEAIRDQYAPLADIVVPGGNYSNLDWGDNFDYHIAHCTGDLHVSGQLTGGGILIIDGDLFCSGQMTWYGLVVVLGDITFTGGGQGTHIYGSVMVQGGITQQTVSGNADIKYSSLALSRLASLSPYVVASWHEL